MQERLKELQLEKAVMQKEVQALDARVKEDLAALGSRPRDTEQVREGGSGGVLDGWLRRLAIWGNWMLFYFDEISVCHAFLVLLTDSAFVPDHRCAPTPAGH